MDTKTFIDLIETVSQTLNKEGFEHIELNHEGTSLVLNKKSVATIAQVQGAPPVQPFVPSPQSPVPSEVQEAKPEASAPKAQGQSNDYKIIESPIVGTFYNAASPESKPYVQVGDKVNKGDVVCIVEAMKLMNEIEAEVQGEIVEILVDNEGPVEYGQALFKVK